MDRAANVLAKGSLAAPLQMNAEVDSFPLENRCAIIVDYATTQAVATALVLSAMMKPCMHHEPTMIPMVPPNGHELPSNVNTALIICTNGIFENADALRMLMMAAERGACQLPIISEEHFRFPLPESAQKHEKAVTAVCSHPESLLAIIVDIFKAIAVVFQPEEYSSTDQVLQAKALEITKRLSKRQEMAVLDPSRVQWPQGEGTASGGIKARRKFSL